MLIYNRNSILNFRTCASLNTLAAIASKANVSKSSKSGASLLEERNFM